MRTSLERLLSFLFASEATTQIFSTMVFYAEKSYFERWWFVHCSRVHFCTLFSRMFCLQLYFMLFYFHREQKRELLTEPEKGRRREKEEIFKKRRNWGGKQHHNQRQQEYMAHKQWGNEIFCFSWIDEKNAIIILFHNLQCSFGLFSVLRPSYFRPACCTFIIFLWLFYHHHHHLAIYSMAFSLKLLFNFLSTPLYRIRTKYAQQTLNFPN